jgi:hypothetical protein
MLGKDFVKATAVACATTGTYIVTRAGTDNQHFEPGFSPRYGAKTDQKKEKS